jgi:hypothetical protein
MPKKLYYPKTEDEIFKLTAKETGYSEEQVRFVVKHAWIAIRYYLANMLESKQGILINTFARFTFKPRTIARKIKVLNYKLNYITQKQGVLNKLDELTKLLEKNE